METNHTPSPAQQEPTIDEHTSLTPAQREIAIADIRALVAAKTMSPEVATKSFDELGVPLDQRTDSRTDGAKALDEAGFVSASPEHYQIRWGRPGENITMTKPMKEFDTAVRAWLHHAEFPRELGNSLIKAVTSTAETTQHMTEAELVTYGHQEMGKLRAVYRETLEEKLRSANRMIHDLEAKQPGLKNLLTSRGIGDNAMVVHLLLDASDRYWMRRKS